MGSKSKIAILIPGLLVMLLYISSEVATRDLKEGEVVKERNRVGDVKLVGGIHDVSKFSIPGIGASYIGGVIPSTGGAYISGAIPVIGGGYIGGGGFPVGSSFPGIGGGGFPVGSSFPGIGGGGFPIGGSFPGQVFCRFSCCVKDALGTCIRCCSVSR